MGLHGNLLVNCLRKGKGEKGIEQVRIDGWRGDWSHRTSTEKRNQKSEVIMIEIGSVKEGEIEAEKESVSAIRWRESHPAIWRVC